MTVGMRNLSATALMDLAGAEMISRLEQELRVLDVRPQIVEALAAVRDRLRAVGLEERLGRVDRFTTVADAVDAALWGLRIFGGSQPAE
jgi:sulfate permease, SulP family